MSKSCEQCGTQLLRPFSRLVLTMRCRRCGCVYHVDGERISPFMRPVEEGRTLSPWMLPHTRPVEPGDYECEFRNVGRLTLHWDGLMFTHGGRRVQMRDLKTWRGSWSF